MERKAYNSLNEAALQVQLDELDKSTLANYVRGAAHDIDRKAVSTGRNIQARNLSPAVQRQAKKVAKRHRGINKAVRKLSDDVEYNEVDSRVLEYFSNYFGDNLNEDTSNEEIMQAVYDLIDLTEAVLDVVEGSRGLKRTQRRIQNYNPRGDYDPKTYRKMGGADTVKKKQEYELEQRPKEFALRQLHRAGKPGIKPASTKGLEDTIRRAYDTSTYHPIKKHQRGMLKAIGGKDMPKLVHAAGVPSPPKMASAQKVQQYRDEREHAKDFGHEHLGSERKGLEMLTKAKLIDANPKLEKRLTKK